MANRKDTLSIFLLRLFLGLALLIGATAGASAEIANARFAFNKRCATCHDATALIPRLMKLPDDVERHAFLEQFLSRHHARDADERRLIIDYLLKHQ